MKIRGSAIVLSCALFAALSAACSRAEAIEEIPAGTEVTVVTQDGALVRGKIATVNPEVVTLTGERPNTTTQVARRSITEVRRASAAAEEPAAERVRSVTIPENTVLDVTLESSHASDTSRAEDPVRATLDSPIVIDEVTVIPSGSVVTGHVTGAQESGNVKGRAELGLRFDRIAFRSVTYDIATKPIYWVAEGTKKDDAVKIGVGAAAGAIIGAIAGGKKGAAIGTAVGAGGGTAVVLATDGDEVRLASGRKLKVSLTDPLLIRTR
ncbi:MAG: hypothetical protein AB7N29_09875 [Vicinamibacterales bacterium]